MGDIANKNEDRPKLSFSERIKAASKKQWIKFSLLAIFFIGFVFWTHYYWVLLLLIVFFDSYILKYIPWSFWRKSKNKSLRSVMEWVDAIGFALVAVWVINTFFFQNYQIPTSSLEKSLLVGDFLLVSKMSYGTRSPMTPLSFPLAQHTLPILNTKSYIDKPQVDYQRFKGTGTIERGNIVVFNYPAGDTVALKKQDQDYYSLVKTTLGGREAVDKIYGDVVYRPVDRRENYVKRAVGLPGETLQIIDDQVYIDGNKIAEPKNMELSYYIQTDGTQLSSKVLEDIGVSKDDYPSQNRTYDLRSSNPESFQMDSLRYSQLGFVSKNKNFGIVYEINSLTREMVNKLKAKPFILGVNPIKEQIQENVVLDNGQTLDYYPFYYPINYKTGWTRSDYGPIWIPKKGSTITFDKDVDYKVATYERAIKNYEGNDFEYRDGKVYINGKQVDSYTFKFDYYFMMGDNRHNSADSRSWGFVPEDHIVGKPLFVWLSLDKDKGWFDGKIRWNRIFTSAEKD